MAATPISPRAQDRQKARLSKLEEKWSVLFNQVRSTSKKCGKFMTQGAGVIMIGWGDIDYFATQFKQVGIM